MRDHSTGDDGRLDALLASYRSACAPVEPSVNFMPHLWERIDNRRRFSILLGRLTSGFVTASVVLTLGLVYLSIPERWQNRLPAVTYVEALEASHAADNLDYFEPVHLDLSESVVIDEL
jgi:hypothetical protein